MLLVLLLLSLLSLVVVLVQVYITSGVEHIVCWVVGKMIKFTYLSLKCVSGIWYLVSGMYGEAFLRLLTHLGMEGRGGVCKLILLFF